MPGNRERIEVNRSDIATIKTGGQNMNQDKIEIERIDNLVRNFGWIKASEELTEKEIILTLKKTRSTGPMTFGEGAD